MSQPLQYASPTAASPSRALVLFANLSAVYPLLLVGCLYGEWLLGWYMLGHPPEPSVDDPVDIPVSRWVHPITLVVLVGMFPAAAATLALNVLHLVHHRVRGGRLAVRFSLLLLLWAGMFGLLRWDPLDVGVWWMD